MLRINYGVIVINGKYLIGIWKWWDRGIVNIIIVSHRIVIMLMPTIIIILLTIIIVVGTIVGRMEMWLIIIMVIWSKIAKVESDMVTGIIEHE